MTLISIFMMAYLFVLFTFVPTFFEKVHGLSPVTTGWVMSFGGFLCFIGQVFLPYLSDRIGRKPSLIILFLIGILGGILFITAPPNASVGLLTVYFGIFGVGLSSYPLYLVIVPSESVPFTIAATAVALPQGLGEIVGATIFPAIGGHIADLYGLTYTLYMVVIACVLSLILALFMKETAPKFMVAKGEELSA
jgi:MFS family permease